MQRPFVDTLALAERGQVESVRIVRDEHEAGLDDFTVDRDAERLPVREHDRPRASSRERVAASPLRFAALHQPPASGHAENVGRRGPCELRNVLPLPEDMGSGPDDLRLGGELGGARRIRAGMRVDEKEAGQRRPD